MTVTAI